LVWGGGVVFVGVGFDFCLKSDGTKKKWGPYDGGGKGERKPCKRWPFGGVRGTKKGVPWG